MDKEEALTEFLNGLRVAINNSLAYSRQHPFFLKTSQDFKAKIDQALNFLNPIKVSVSTEALFMDGKNWAKVVFSSELARILHQRKIKSIEFCSGATLEELADFLSLLSLQPKEIIRSGGLDGLLKKKEVPHIHVEDLDYSVLLGSGEESAKDIWLYLFKQTMDSRDEKKIIGFTDNFLKGVNSLNAQDVIEDDELRGDLGAFFGHLKNGDREKFLGCYHKFSAMILNSAVQATDDDIGKLKEVFSHFDNNELTDIFSTQLTSGKLNTLNLGLFSRLAGEERAEKIVSGLTNSAEVKAGLKHNPGLLKRIKGLLSGPSEENIPATYRTALIALIKDFSPAGNFVFDYQQLRFNYRMIILDLLSQEETTPEELPLILQKLDDQLDDLEKEKDFNFLKSLLVTLKNNKRRMPIEASDNIEKRISHIVEDCIWEEDIPEGLEDVVDNLDKIFAPADFYLNKIFGERKPNAYGIKLFLKFFPSYLGVFYERLEKEHADFEFLSQIAKIVGQADLPVSLPVLKEIFSFGNELIKIEALRAMRSSKDFDPGFLFPILKGRDTILKKEALAVLLRDEACVQNAIDILLGIRSPWGIENHLILENILVVEELNLRRARDYLVAFGKKRFFWNRKLKNKALEVLESWK